MPMPLLLTLRQRHHQRRLHQRRLTQKRKRQRKRMRIRIPTNMCSTHFVIITNFPNRTQLQLQATSQLSTSAMNGIAVPGDVSSVGVLGGGMLNGVVGGVGANNASQNKYDRWEFPRHRLKFFNILGEGAFGQVWRCEATDIDGVDGVTTVAVKTLKENAAEVEKKDLLSELEVMKSLDPHVNVVRFLGCCTDKDPIFVIIEYVNRGKLQTYLRNSRAERHYGNTHGKSNILTSGDLTSFMYQVAKGMDYLTSRG
ncbi:tyrosine kinase receptor Cad96Ca-like, partial [Teleopsis dalmanni]|uniref:tyrosine kinase receptor Cad96Ca-like n=1 Tax=Teleopsis dalmanni TaxID=139649 RepID=UPI0018CDC0C2